MWGERTNGAPSLSPGRATFVFDTDTDFGDDTIFDAGRDTRPTEIATAREVVDSADPGVDILLRRVASLARWTPFPP
jgi:hypothetical protein